MASVTTRYSSQLTAWSLPFSSADGDHRPGPLDGRGDARLDLAVRGDQKHLLDGRNRVGGAQRLTDVDFAVGHEAGAQTAVTGQAHPAARAAKRFGDGVDKADSALPTGNFE